MAEAKAKATTIAKGKRKKKAGATKPASNPVAIQAKKKTPESPQTVSKKQPPVADTSKNLPEPVQSRKVLCKQVGLTRPTPITLDDVTATTKSIYVDDIHHANPTHLQTIHWVILKDHPVVIARVEQSEYESILKERPKLNHLVSVVDCSVVPTLTYGSWKASQLSSGFPTAKQIAERDEEFKTNPTVLHNPPVKLELLDQIAADEEDVSEEEEELLLFDDEEEDDDVEDDEDDGEDWTSL